MSNRIYCIFVNSSSQKDLFIYKNSRFVSKETRETIKKYFESEDIKKRLSLPKSETVRNERYSLYSSLLVVTYNLYGLMPKVSFLSEKPKFSEELIFGGEAYSLPVFNISHSNRLGLICISEDKDSVGCDVQSAFSVEKAKRLEDRFIKNRGEQIPTPLPLLPCADYQEEDENFLENEIVLGFFDSRTGEFSIRSSSALSYTLGCNTENTESAVELNPLFSAHSDSSNRFETLKNWCALESSLKCIGGGFGSLCELDKFGRDLITFGSYLRFCGEDYYASHSSRK